jgi:5'-nucleotidase/UDP-sugar diphosphatase
MSNRNSLFRVNRRLFCILAKIPVAASFWNIPVGLETCSGKSQELYFCVLHTNDIQSELMPNSPAVDYDPAKENSTVGGLARLTTAINEIRDGKMKEGEPVLLFDVGDFLGGTPFAWLALSGYAAELTIMQKMGYDTVAIGNHEYDYGPGVLAKYLLQAGYPEAHQKTLVLASNTEAPPGDPLATQGLYRKTGMLELENGLKVGVFSIMGKEAVQLVGDAGDVQFLDQYETARQMVAELKEQGANVIVNISHSGLDEDREMSREVRGIDVIVGGHSHTTLFKPIVQGDTIIVQAGYRGEYLGQLELAYNPDTGKVRVRNEENNHAFLIPIDDSFACNPDVDALVQGYTGILNGQINEMTGGKFGDIMGTVAKSDFILSRDSPAGATPLGNFVTDAMRIVAQEVTGERVDIASEASGCIGKSIFPGTMEYSTGNISFYEIIEAVGMGHGYDGHPGCPIVSFYVTGEEVRRVLEINVFLQKLMGDCSFLQSSGLRYSYNPANAVVLTIPLVNLPIPTNRAVTSADLYVGDGVQPVDGDGYVPLKRGDDKLYRVVTDGYLLQFLSVLKDKLPRLTVVPKNAAREPVPPERFGDLIVHRADGTELKVWEAVMSYAAAQPPGVDGIPRISGYYKGAAGRVNRAWAFPLLGWLLLIVAPIVAGIVFLV